MCLWKILRHHILLRFDRPIYKLGKHINTPSVDIFNQKSHRAVKTEVGQSQSVLIFCWKMHKRPITFFVLTARYTNLEITWMHHKWTSSNKNLTGQWKLQAGSALQAGGTLYLAWRGCAGLSTATMDVQIWENVQRWLEDGPAKNEGIRKRWWMWPGGLGLGMWAWIVTRERTARLSERYVCSCIEERTKMVVSAKLGGKVASFLGRMTN